MRVARKKVELFASLFAAAAADVFFFAKGFFVCVDAHGGRRMMTGSPPVSRSKRAKPLLIARFHSSVGRDVTRAAG